MKIFESGKFYAIDLWPFDDRTDLATPTALTQTKVSFRILASTKKPMTEDNFRRRIVPINDPYMDLFLDALERCYSVKEVPKEDLILWVGLPFQNVILDDLLKG